MTEQISVVIVDDHALFRRGVSQLLNSDPGVTVLAEASCGKEGIDMIMRMTPDAALVDLHMRDRRYHLDPGGAFSWFANPIHHADRIR